MADYGVNLTRSSAYRAIASFKENDSIIGSEVRCLRVVSTIMENEAAGELLTVRSIMERLATLGEKLHKSTIYRVLERLNSSALIQTIRRGRQTYYQWRRGVQQGFLTCVQCNKTIEFKQEDLDERAKALCEDSGYEFQRIELVLRSVCTDCWAVRENANVD